MSPKPQTVHAPENAKIAEKGLAGRGAFAKAILTPTTIRREKDEREIAASAVILRTVIQIKFARNTVDEYRNQVIEHAKLIVSERHNLPPSENGQADASAPLDISTARGLLLATLSNMGVKAAITGEDKHEDLTIFILDVGGETHKMYVKDAHLGSADPVGDVEKVATFLGIGRTKEEAREQMLARRRQMQPEAGAIGVDQQCLERRHISYDSAVEIPKGASGANGTRFNQFTYLIEGLESTFWAPQELRGKDLLRFLDGKIFEQHINSNVPIPASALEEAAEIHPSMLDFKDAGSDELRKIAKALHLISNGEMIGVLPADYGAAASAIRLSSEYMLYQQLLETEAISKPEADGFRKAFAVLDHPSHVMAKALHKGMAAPDGSVSKEEAELIKATMSINDQAPTNVCESALRNLAQAYSLLADGHTSSKPEEVAAWDYKRLQSMHLRMILTLRVAANEMSLFMVNAIN